MLCGRFAPSLGLCILALSARATQLDPTIEKIVHDISQERIADTMKKLTSFETRGNFTDWLGSA